MTLASRGRYIGENGSVKQHAEPCFDEYIHSLTTVEKDNYILEIESGDFCVVDEAISTNGTENIGTIRATYYKNGERNVIQNLVNNRGYEGVVVPTNHNTYRIRKLMPVECWRLMGFTEEDCERAKALGVSDTQLYKQAGNGIITNCVELMFEHLYKSQINPGYECYDENFTRGVTS